jgi:hypothetical protein
MNYKAIEVIPEEFYAVINSSGKNYHFTIWNNACAIRHFEKWGEKPPIDIIREIGQAAYIGTLAFWLLADEEKKDFAGVDDFNKKIEPHYAKKSDLDTKVLKSMSIGFIPAESKEEAAASTARFSQVSETKARTIYDTAPKGNRYVRPRHTRNKSKNDTD